jgi:hypothetical protein
VTVRSSADAARPSQEVEDEHVQGPSVRRLALVRDYEAWKTRRVDEHELAYAWADGIYVRAGLERKKAALLVIIGALRDGRKERARGRARLSRVD